MQKGGESLQRGAKFLPDIRYEIQMFKYSCGFFNSVNVWHTSAGFDVLAATNDVFASQLRAVIRGGAAACPRAPVAYNRAAGGAARLPVGCFLVCRLKATRRATEHCKFISLRQGSR